MNFKIAKRELLDALSICSRAISATTPLPSLSGIKFSVTSDTLTLVSSDSNISIKTEIKTGDDKTLTIYEEGEVVLEARYILEMVRKIASDSVTFEIIDGTLVRVSGGNSEFKINGMSAADYPFISFDINSAQPFKLQTSLFNEMIDETAFACSDKEIRPVLTGVNMKAADRRIVIVATDSYRLASKTIDIDTDLHFNITVPAKYLNEVVHCIGNQEEITIYIDRQKISFVFDNTIIDTRLLDDEFPDTSRLVPNDFRQKLTISAKEMVNALDRTLFIKADGKNTVKMSINDQRLELTSSNQANCSFLETIPVISYEGDPLEISCSGKYLLDAIKAIKSDEVVINFSGELKPMVVHEPENKSLIQLISPVRTYR